MKGLYAVPLGIPFLPTLVHELIRQTSADPLSLAKYLVILPTRRGCLILHEAFQKATPQGCRILPRIMALADIEEGHDLPGYVPPEILPKAMPTWQRLGLLTQLVMAFEKGREGDSQNPAGAIRLARELMRLVDEVETTQLHLKDLKNIVGENHAAHWQLTLDFLSILTDLWPPILQQAELIEPAARKRLILEQLTHHWQPDYPVILAGTSGTRPATSKLAQKILSFEEGSVVLAGVDQTMFTQNTQIQLSETHPQYTLNQLIHRLKKPITWLMGDQNILSRSQMVSLAMMPTTQENWGISSTMADELLSSLQAIEASSPQEEARQIALIMRYELETTDRTIALVTPDTELSRCVQSALGRWGLRGNLSSGEPLTLSLVGRFLSLSSQLTQNLNSGDLLALLKHPLFAKGRDRLDHLKQTHQFEINILRELQPSEVHSLPFPGYELCEPLLALNDGHDHSLVDYLKAHQSVVEAMVGGAGENSSLWDEDDGQVALAFWESLLDQAHHYPPLRSHDYPAILRHLMSQEVVRDGEGFRSRILILGALEARLLQADVVILGSLNEGTWPGHPDDDPWLSRAMRERFGLPSPERKIGLSAHDFCTGMTAPKVYLTRSVKRNGSPTLPSRWWQRLFALMDTSEASLIHQDQPWGIWSQVLDQPTEQITFDPPAPCPPLSARPRRFSITEVGTFLQDPYSIYAKRILNLKPLNPLEADLLIAERGQAIHQILDAFVRLNVDPASPEAMNTFENLGREAFGSLMLDPRAKAFWWPRFQRLGHWFLNQMIADQSVLKEIQTEVEGMMEISSPNGPIILRGKADRIDITTMDQVRIIDYKTGSVPSKKMVSEGYAPQLSLEGVFIKAGGFPNIDVKDIEHLSYWRVTGGTPAGEIMTFDKPEDLISQAEEGVRRLFEVFLEHETPFYACPDPATIPDYHDYAHLERLKEWI